MQEHQEIKIEQNQEPELSSIEMQNQLFIEIEKKQTEMSRQDLLVLAGQVFDYSVEDGLRLASKIRLTPKEISEIISTPSFFVKHQDLAELLQKEIYKLNTIPKDDETALEIGQSYDKYKASKENGDFFNKYQNKPEILSGDARPIQLEIDKLYLKYIQNREIKNITENDPRTKGERLAESNLHIAQRTLGENYYSGSLLDLVCKKMVKDGVVELEKYSDDEKKELVFEYLKKNNIFSKKDLSSIFNTPFISKDEVNKLKEKLDLSEESLDKARYRPIDVVYATEKSMAEKELKTELNQSLSKHMDGGVKIVLDNEKGVYSLSIRQEEKDEEKIIPGSEINVGKYKKLWIKTEINGQVVYIAQKNNNNMVVVVGNKEKKEYTNISNFNLVEIDGQPAYSVFDRIKFGDKNGGFYFIINDKAYGHQDYNSAAKEHNKSNYIQSREVDEYEEAVKKLYEDNKSKTKRFEQYLGQSDSFDYTKYSTIGDLVETDKYMAYSANTRKNKRVVVIALINGIMQEEFKEHEEEFDQIHFLKPKPEGLLVCAQIGNIVKTFTIKVPKQNNLTVKEQEKLDLLNLVHDPEIEKIDQYFEEKIIKAGEKKEGVSKTILGQVKDFIKKSPELFLQTLSAKKDRLPDLYIQQIIKKIFPQAYQDSNDRYFGIKRNNFTGDGNSLRPSLDSDLRGGDPTSETDKNREIMKLHNPISDLIITNIYGKYDKKTAKWQKAFFPINNQLIEPENNTITLNIPQGEKNLVLPKPINSQIIPERVKQKNSLNKDKDLQLQTNSLGEVEVAVDADSKTVVYSIAQSTIAPIIEKISTETYEKFKKQFNKSFENDLNEQTVILPEDLTEFIESVKTLPPKQRIIEIEKFVREIGYYDFENKEVMELKNNKTIEEKLYIMQTRLDELKEKDANLNKLSHKRYAGVCADFAMLTTALLRKAEILSGVAVGYRAEGTQVTQANSHATSFAVFPNKNGGNQVIIIDGTPEGVDEEQRARMRFISTPSLEDKETKSIEELSKIKGDANKKLDKILKLLKDNDLEKIRQLTNGELEDVLNMVLKYSVDTTHVQALKKVLEAYWYSPIKNKNLNDISDKIEIMKFLSTEISSQRKITEVSEKDKEKPAGSLLFETIESYVQKFLKDGKAENNKQCFDLLDSLIDLNKDNLNEIEQKASVAIIAYLRAKNMGGRK